MGRRRFLAQVRSSPNARAQERKCAPGFNDASAMPYPTAAWTLQQLRESIPCDHQYRFIIHDHDAIFSAELDVALTRLGLKVITTPVAHPTGQLTL